MNNIFDLHVHTRFSDGEFSPAEVVRLASECGVKTIAITDHDNVDGIDEGLEAGAKTGVQVIPGVELSTQYQGCGEIHILGYFIDQADRTLRGALSEFKKVRLIRGEMIVEAINRYLMGKNLVPLSIERLKSIADGAIGRPHISRLLVDMGYAGDTNDAFRKFLIPFNIPKKKLTPQEAIRLIDSAGGIAVLAHPHMWNEKRETMEREDTEKGIRAIAGYGLAGLEAFYFGYTRSDTEFFCALARDLELVVTAGTDFHSLTYPGTLPGCFDDSLNIPADLVDKLWARKAGRTQDKG